MRHNNRQERQSRREKKASRERVVTPRAKEEVELAKAIQTRTHFQKSLLSAVNQKDAVFVNGPAGTGKTFVVMSTVIDWLKSGKIKKIVLSRPTVGMGNSLGLLPGDIREKFEPYLAALVQVIKDRYGANYYETQLNNKNIEFVPLEYVRGRSFEDSVVIVDEFQNTDEETAYTIMTRLGEGSKMFCLGDITQNDMKGKESGLDWAIDFIDRHNLFHLMEFVEGSSDDIVRSEICKAVVKAREKDLEGNK
ncbi:PhoH family protein [Pectobacterium atrosepticum]|uniref:PhoH-like protein n=1 Tax=Pectobacterium phage phiTE TaxID=1116482 RepID=K9L5M4_9CAUD|nr:PhoH family protein [Pectobacterium atrosepticum]YP_007392608.1 PhoH-like phosphate starvation-inducible [Pectobacterium phage phiTE]AEZ66312.1 phosphate starvation-inducible phoH-like protein [Pectobacterium phage phiTE]MCL6318850.1 PhoH family protein [Pectobacterium atrosepticum]MCL6408155.1 PhoH family protein [Dickeya dadantii]